MNSCNGQTHWGYDNGTRNFSGPTRRLDDRNDYGHHIYHLYGDMMDFLVLGLLCWFGGSSTGSMLGTAGSIASAKAAAQHARVRAEYMEKLYVNGKQIKHS